MPRDAQRRRLAYVTGTRAEFGLMSSTLRAIQRHPLLDLQLIVTGMHLSRAHGRTIEGIRQDGWTIDATVPWKGDVAEATGSATRDMAKAFAKLKPDIVLVCGDRVEPFAAATAAHLEGRIVAHVHGGDRAQGQVDDTLRHVMTKLAHLHFPATAASAERIFQLGEDRFRIYRVGTPGLDGIEQFRGSTFAGWPNRGFALVLLHPDSAEEDRQRRQAEMVLAALRAEGVERFLIVASNNDPGWHGIAAAWEAASDLPAPVRKDLPRDDFLRAMASAAFLIGNSSSGIIEAASLKTPVINIGDRQKGRERSANVVDVAWNAAALRRAIRTAWNNGRPRVFTGRNVYGGGAAGEKIAAVLAKVPLDDRLRQKLIRY